MERSNVAQSRHYHFQDSTIAWVFAISIYICHFLNGGADNRDALLDVIIISLNLLLAVAISPFRVRYVITSLWTLLPALLFMAVIFLQIIGGVSSSAFSNMHALLSVTVTSINNWDVSRLSIELFKLLGAACAFNLSLIIASRDKLLHECLSAILIVGALFSAYSLITFYYFPYTTMGLTEKYIHIGRLTASFQSANTAGTMFSSLMILSFQMCVIVLEKLRSVNGLRPSRIFEEISLPLTSYIVAGGATICTGSRTAIAIAALANLLLIIFAFKRIQFQSSRGNKHLSEIILAIALILTALSATMVPRISSVIFDAASRAAIYQTHLSAIKLHPIFGRGLGSFSEINRNLLNSHNYNNLWSINAMHNVYLQWLEQTGILGLLLISTCIMSIIIIAIIKAGNERYILNSSAAMTIVGLILTQNITDFSLENTSIILWFSFFLGLILADIQHRPSRWAQR